MLKLYTWNTPNGQKPALLLEELELEYQVTMIDISAGDQFTDNYVAINPNSKIPALVDGDIALFESGAILQYLAEKEEHFLPKRGQERATVLAWTYWQVGGFGPMIGQWGHFLNSSEQLPYAIERYLSETLRLFRVLEKQLRNSVYVVGDSYSIADMMIFPWAKGGLKFLDNAAANRLPPLDSTRRWIGRVDERPATRRAFERLQSELER
ncbi:MAG: glutathione S-transferase N-terminal domain-containing protein [Pseudomonadota bacterium]